jgi:hypothetical protein
MTRTSHVRALQIYNLLSILHVVYDNIHSVASSYPHLLHIDPVGRGDDMTYKQASGPSRKLNADGNHMTSRPFCCVSESSVSCQ